ncbi:MAG: glutamate synthase subunit beta [bacterium]
MGDPRGFLKFKRITFAYRPVCERIKDYNEVATLHTEDKTKQQASRCMDCGTPFCNWGCPLGNYIPEWNDKIYRGQWQEAFVLLNETANLPEITGRVCPAPCETACVLGINDSAVTVKDNELAIIEKAFKEGYIKPNIPVVRTGKKVAVIGSGPAGMTAAAQLNKAGHAVTLFEKDDQIGGFTRYGIPDFKLDKSIIERRRKIWEAEGINIKTAVNVGGADFPADKLLKDFDAVCISIGCRVARDMNIPGRQLSGIYQAMQYLEQSNRRVAGEKIPADKVIDAKGKNVLVIGGGDTGADCVGTANRQGAKCVTQIEIMPRASKNRPVDQPWPKYPFVFKISSSHEEGVERQWEIATKEFVGENGQVKIVKCSRVLWEKVLGQPRLVMKEAQGSDFEIDADLVVMAMGFTNPPKNGLLEDLKVALDDRGNVVRDAETGATSVSKVFSAGDVSRGPSLVVWAIMEGRKAAEGINEFLKK